MIGALDRVGDGNCGPQGRAKATGDARPSTPPSRRLLCVACGIAITNTGARTQISGQHRHVFCNPAGLVFEIGCFKDAPGAAPAGPPESFFSWFPGYAWRVAICRGCRSHLGWAYGDDDFWGLIEERLVEADGGSP